MHKNFYRNDPRPPIVEIDFDEVRVGDWLWHASKFVPVADKVLAIAPLGGIVTTATTHRGFTRDMWKDGLVVIVDRDAVRRHSAEWKQDCI